MNHLKAETSPYLLQHVNNPVDWHPWSDKAISLARELDKPIFLSIGYSACHWCHVMAHESFEDHGVADILNSSFVSIKVDREELPDVDEIYMGVVQALTGSGGWPLTVFLTPDLKPFFGGTYFPPDDRYGRPGFKLVLNQLSNMWQSGREKIEESADSIVHSMRSQTDAELESGAITRPLLDGATNALVNSYDRKWGGFGDAPKFPPSAGLAFLLRQHRRGGDSLYLDIATHTLDRMAQGGMYDHLGGGFHRYSVDEKWLVPHFEKMLYDNALLSWIYLEAYQLTNKPFFRQIACETLDYVLRDMTDDTGGFHAAEDADSEGVEGKFYVWDKEDILQIIGPENGALFTKFYGVTDDGNFEDHNILYNPIPPHIFAQDYDLSEPELALKIDPYKKLLLDARNQRNRPGKDDKILVSWNGLMISSLMKGYQIFGVDGYRKAADKALRFILNDMISADGLRHCYRQGTSKIPAYLDDYANLVQALIDSYEATFNHEWLVEANRLTEQMIDLFWDASKGTFYSTYDEHTKLFMRSRSTYDGAVPSGNSIAAMNLLRLSKFVDNQEYYDKSESILRLNYTMMKKAPRGFFNLLLAADYYLYPPLEIAIVGHLDESATVDIIKAINSLFIPNKIIAFRESATKSDSALKLPLLEDKEMIDNRATAFICQNYACEQPITAISELVYRLTRTL